MLYLILFGAFVGACIGGWQFFPAFRAYVCFFVSYVGAIVAIALLAGKYPEELVYIVGGGVAFFGLGFLGRGLLKFFPSTKPIAQGLFWGGVFAGGHAMFLLCRLRGYF